MPHASVIGSPPPRFSSGIYGRSSTTHHQRQVFTECTCRPTFRQDAQKQHLRQVMRPFSALAVVAACVLLQEFDKAINADLLVSHKPEYVSPELDRALVCLPPSNLSIELRVSVVAAKCVCCSHGIPNDVVCFWTRLAVDS